MVIPAPENGINFIDVHCHLPFPRPRNDKLPSDEKQYADYFKEGGVYLITCSIDTTTLDLVLKFIENKKNIGFTCGWAPQTVTYTPSNLYKEEYEKWVAFILKYPEKYLAIGEIGLDFHHAKTLDNREKQIEELEKIFETTKALEKPYILHVRNAAEKEFDRAHPNHKFNKKDGANQEVLRVLNEFKINPKKVLWHCFSGPEDYGRILSKQGYVLSVPSSAYGYERWRNVTKDTPIESLLTETDAFFQHPFKSGPINIPSNVKYSVAAIGFSHNLSQKEVSKKTIENAKKFFNLKS
ncbi:MAG TPA: TatD family hydrolase [Candidatus Lokiarchaeia archaeon]